MISIDSIDEFTVVFFQPVTWQQLQGAFPLAQSPKEIPLLLKIHELSMKLSQPPWRFIRWTRRTVGILRPWSNCGWRRVRRYPHSRSGKLNFWKTPKVEKGVSCSTTGAPHRSRSRLGRCGRCLNINCLIVWRREKQWSATRNWVLPACRITFPESRFRSTTRKCNESVAHRK